MPESLLLSGIFILTRRWLMITRSVQGDIFLTQAHTIAIGLSADGRLSVTPLYTALQDRYPVFVSEYHKRGRAEHLSPGGMWVWRESQPWLVGLIVQETPQGATRLRYVEAAMLNLSKNWEREGMRSLALMRLGDPTEWPGARAVLEEHLPRLPLPVIVYEDYKPGVAAESRE
jgi:hypothetical protein